MMTIFSFRRLSLIKDCSEGLTEEPPHVYLTGELLVEGVRR